MSDNDINQNINDNIIDTIETNQENNDVESTVEIENLNSENIQGEISSNQLKDDSSKSIYISTNGDDLIGEGSQIKPFKTSSFGQ